MGDEIYRQSIDGGIRIHRDSGLLWVAVQGEIDCRTVYECIRDGYQSGLIGLSMPTLVDLRTYTGSIEWAEIIRIAALAPWGAAPGAPPARVAYVSEARLFASIVKVVASLFRRNDHRHFGDLDGALGWLRGAQLA